MRLLLFTSLLLVAYKGCIRQPTAVAEQQLALGLGLPAFLLAGSDEQTVFPYGVASGDPLSESVLLWTMLAPAQAKKDSLVYWQISPSPSFKTLANEGYYTTSANHHYRVKLEADKLSPSTTYYYRFRASNGQWSATGRTKTAAAPNSQQALQLGVVSCNALEWGYFNAFEALANNQEIAAIIHLGDYIYEYGTGEYGDTSLGRIHQPRHEILTAQDYHQRYAQYRSDPQLQAAHAAHPFICVWDDHEIANNSHLAGAENHQEEDGDYLLRMSAAKQIYYDWMPVRENENGQLYRSFQFGQMADLHMLDERLAGRTAPASDFEPQTLADTSLHILGDTQLQWLSQQLKQSNAHWQLIGNQVLFAQLDLSNILPQYAVNVDAWDGFRYEKQRLLDTIQAQQLQNLVFLTGDTHCSWYFNITTGKQADSPLLHEFATPSVSSANYDEFIQGWDTLAVAKYRLFRDNPALLYTNLTDHGYLLLRINEKELQTEFHYMKSIRERTTREKATKIFKIPHVSTHPS